MVTICNIKIRRSLFRALKMWSSGRIKLYRYDCKERCDLEITQRERKMFEEEMLS